MSIEVVTEITIAVSHFVIPLCIAIFAVRQDLRFSYTLRENGTGSFKLTVISVTSFILLSGVMHLVDSFAGWGPPRVVGIILKILTAAISLLSAVFLVMALPKILDLTRRLEVTQRGLPEELQRVHQMVYDTSTHMISVHNQNDGRFLYVNRACSSLGMDKEDLLNKTLFEVVEEEDLDSIRNALGLLQGDPSCPPPHPPPLPVPRSPSPTPVQADTATTVQALYHIRHKVNGKKIMVDSSLFIGKYTTNITEEEVLIVTWRDVTDRMEMEVRTREQEKIKLEAMARQQFISSIAHDLKTPLTSFQLSLGLLQASPSITEEEHHVIREAEVSLELMSVTIGQAIDFSRITDQNQLKPKRGSLDLHSLVYKCEKFSWTSSRGTSRLGTKAAAAADEMLDVQKQCTRGWSAAYKTKSCRTSQRRSPFSST
ncbi:unnamed protein product [Discosporangium mesarthrocarpum]